MPGRKRLLQKLPDLEIFLAVVQNSKVKKKSCFFMRE